MPVAPLGSKLNWRGLHMMRRAVGLLSFAVVLSFAPIASAQIPTLAWNPNTESDIGGYVVYYGTNSNSYSQQVDVGRNTVWPLTALQPGRRYYITVRAYTTAGQFSGPAQEIVFDFPFAPQLSSLLWRNKSNGQLAMWTMQGLNQLGGAALSPGAVADLAWNVAGSADFNADGHRDLLWQHDSGDIAAWLMQGPTQLAGRAFAPSSTGDPDWRIATTGDLNRDGYPDLIWRHRVNGTIAVWLMNGLTRIEGKLLTPDTVSDINWEIVGTGDFDMDGWVDLVWRHKTDGYISVWYMTGSVMRAGRSLSPDRVADVGWRIRAVSDVNGDYRPDLIWEHTNGQISSWIMNGLSLAQGVLFAPAVVSDPNWLIVGAR
jgi:hypothetical protein